MRFPSKSNSGNDVIALPYTKAPFTLHLGWIVVATLLSNNVTVVYEGAGAATQLGTPLDRIHPHPSMVAHPPPSNPH